MCSECYGHRPNYCLYSHRDECKDLCIRIFTVLSFFAVVFPVAQTVKRLPATQETWVQSLGQEDPLEKGMAIHSSILFFFFPSILTWRIPWREEPGRLQSMGSQTVGQD